MTAENVYGDINTSNVCSAMIGKVIPDLLVYNMDLEKIYLDSD